MFASLTDALAHNHAAARRRPAGLSLCTSTTGAVAAPGFASSRPAFAKAKKHGIGRGFGERSWGKREVWPPPVSPRRWACPSLLGQSPAAGNLLPLFFKILGSVSTPRCCAPRTSASPGPTSAAAAGPPCCHRYSSPRSSRRRAAPRQLES